MKKWAVLLCMVIGGCGLPNQTYSLDGVHVVLEGSHGPSMEHLSETTNIYRDAVQEYLTLEDDVELSVWRSLREFVWTNRPVPDYAQYDRDSGVLTANWMGGCALHVPLYVALTHHYIEAPTEGDLMWADLIQDAAAPSICDGTNAYWTPW